MVKPDDDTFKNRHINRNKDVDCLYNFPNTNKPLTQFCTVEDILYELTPIGKNLKEEQTKRKENECN